MNMTSIGAQSEVSKIDASYTPSKAKKINFAEVLANSNSEAKLRREDSSSENLTTSGNYRDFLQKLQKKNHPSSKNTLGKDDFLKLFMAQLKNQDPLKPKDGTELASQLAQFNGVEQMVNLNKTLKRIEDTAKTDRQHNYINYIGKNGVVATDRAYFDGKELSEIKAVADTDLANIAYRIIDQNGSVVHEEAIAQNGRAEIPIGWSGTLPSGNKSAPGDYRVEVFTRDVSGREHPIMTKATAKIQGLDFSNSSAKVLTDLGSFDPSKIITVKEAEQS